ncbi:hypothetical protein RJ640_002795 [Escallonia rubra]|uniref:Uncharacterized protein n=1 Tax=Escallonia rubra TaxID=112253 RepID=A0AA88U8Z8_9ASTE|nr:hypothetical protein RJ640_002795 [Escallonia rubra]
MTQLGFLQKSPITSFSSETTSFLPNEAKQASFAVSYLVNNCGLSPEVASFTVSKFKRLRFASSKRPDCVLALLRDHGFTNTQISKLITTHPLLLLANPEETLLPKLKFFHSIGASSDDIASNPRMLKNGLHNRIVPMCNFLKSMLLSDREVVSIMKLLRWNLHDVHITFAPNVELLKQVGVPHPLISAFVSRNPDILLQETSKFDQCVKKLLKMGFDPSKWAFVKALLAILGMSESTWEHKQEVYKRWGWSDHEISVAFKNYPTCMALSENKIMSVMGFLVNEMGFQSTAISRIAGVLLYSLEKRIIPRCSVLRVLQLNGLLKKVPSGQELLADEMGFQSRPIFLTALDRASLLQFEEENYYKYPLNLKVPTAKKEMQGKRPGKPEAYGQT